MIAQSVHIQKARKKNYQLLNFAGYFGYFGYFHKNFLIPGLNSAEITWLKTVHLYDLGYED